MPACYKKEIYLNLILLLFSGFSLFSQISVERGPYLQELTDTSVIVCWRTSQSTDSRVYYDLLLGGQSDSVSELSQKVEHKLKLSGLSPNTLYYYSVANANKQLTQSHQNYRFKTAPDPGSEQNIRVWAIGDFGKGNTEQGLVRDAYLDYTDTIHTDVWLWLGDNAYQSGTDQEYQDNVFDSSNAYGEIMPYMPFMPSPGNHDYLSVSPPNPTSSIDPNNHSGPYFDIVDLPTNGEGGGFPSGTELYYSFDYANVHFVSINSEIGSINLLKSSHDWIGTLPYFNPLASSFTSSPFTDWLHNDLQQNEQRWTIAYFHQPPYTDGSHSTETFYEVFMKAMRENIVPILEQYNVDLVLSGHSHVYERSYLIKGHYDDADTFDPNTMIIDGNSGYENLNEAYVKDLSKPDGEEGTVYIVCGNSASKKDNPGLQYPAMYYGFGCDTCCGSVVLDINGTRLDGSFITMGGRVLDEFTIHKQDSVSIVEEDEIIQSFDCYPNPFSEEIFINLKLKEKTKLRLELLNIKGQKIKTLFNGVQKGNDCSFVFNKKIKGLPSGNYILSLKMTDRQHIMKIIKL
ncbi:MAG TPA: T9SS type A sorting domain-containing protein [Bacteroidetes bacterium]|nr:T9SS type A sorting domain-containing protein [Bacteroidota bacterium]